VLLDTFAGGLYGDTEVELALGQALAGIESPDLFAR
jgi:hypothetical protein